MISWYIARYNWPNYLMALEMFPRIAMNTGLHYCISAFQLVSTNWAQVLGIDIPKQICTDQHAKVVQCMQLPMVNNCVMWSNSIMCPSISAKPLWLRLCNQVSTILILLLSHCSQLFWEDRSPTMMSCNISESMLVHLIKNVKII